MWVALTLLGLGFPICEMGILMDLWWGWHGLRQIIITIVQGRSGQRGRDREQDLRWADGSNMMKASGKKKQLRSLRRGRVKFSAKMRLVWFGSKDNGHKVIWGIRVSDSPQPAPPLPPTPTAALGPPGDTRNHRTHSELLLPPWPCVLGSDAQFTNVWVSS